MAFGSTTRLFAQYGLSSFARKRKRSGADRQLDDVLDGSADVRKIIFTSCTPADGVTVRSWPPRWNTLSIDEFLPSTSAVKPRTPRPPAYSTRREWRTPPRPTPCQSGSTMYDTSASPVPGLR